MGTTPLSSKSAPKKAAQGPDIVDVLVKEDYISAEDAQRARDFASTYHASAVDFLLTEQLITRDLMGQATAEMYGVPYINISATPPSPELIQKMPEQFARQFRLIPIKVDKKTALLASDAPTKPETLTTAQKVFAGVKIKIGYALPEAIDAILLQYRKTLKTRFSDIIAKEQRIAPEIINEIFEEALTFRTSDIHFERQGEDAVVRFRIDGVLHEAARLSKEYYDNLVNRIKVMSHLRIDEHNTVQDGAIRYAHHGSPVDMRVSIAPTLEGEKIVIRLLSKQVQGFSFVDLGLGQADQVSLEAAAKKPFGMILVTGPTGSGKTTSLYGLLKLLNQPEVNITTIEDPVEYKILGVNQIQVNQATNLTFARGLRAVVRQNPDIILVGEIRDQETAEIAVNAALTGHLLLSTFHANDASTAIPRLLYMGAEPFLLSSTLELIISQRLVRRICERCRYSYTTSHKELDQLVPGSKAYFDDPETLFRGKGCQFCNNTGYNGRVAIFEVIKATKELRELILTRPTSQAIWKLAVTQGSRSMFRDGVEKVKNGTTTIEELIRVANPDQDIS